SRRGGRRSRRARARLPRRTRDPPARGPFRLILIFFPRTLRTERRCHECPMEPYDRGPLSRLGGRPSAVSTSVLSTPAIDVDLHVVLARPLPDVVTATTFVRVTFHEERIAVDLFVCERQVASGADAPALAAAQ